MTLSPPLQERREQRGREQQWLEQPRLPLPVAEGRPPPTDSERQLKQPQAPPSLQPTPPASRSPAQQLEKARQRKRAEQRPALRPSRWLQRRRELAQAAALLLQVQVSVPL